MDDSDDSLNRTKSGQTDPLLRVIHSDAVCSTVVQSGQGAKSERLFSGAWHLSLDVQRKGLDLWKLWNI